jgi:proteasome assembly chaperone (PAC2) family protein
MALLPVSKAAELVGLNRKTMYSYIKSGKVSASKDSKGALLVDTSELIRVFGELRHNKDSESNATRLFETPDVNQIMLDKIEQMARQIESLTEKVVELQKQLALPAPKEEKKGFLQWLFGRIES